MIRRLWLDENGATYSIEVLLVGTILGIGLIVGYTALQVAVTTEFADLGAAVAMLNQSYQYGGLKGHHAVVFGTQFVDNVDACDLPGPVGGASQCVRVCDAETRVAENADD